MMNGCLRLKKGRDSLSKTVAYVSLNIRRQMPEILVGIPIVEESRDGPSNTNTLYHRTNMYLESLYSVTAIPVVV